jgi:MFS superfamily sulfate permease-like transporter/Ca2+-binding EF-hand superfamily protein/CRP-like cAMP-binding protein
VRRIFHIGRCTGKSRIPIAIGGPDLTPMVFLGSFVTEIAQSLAEQLDLEYPEASRRRLLDFMDAERYLSGDILPSLADIRRLGSGSSDEEFCFGYHLQNHEEQCRSYHEQLQATVTAAISVSSLVLGVLFFSLGRFKMTRLVSFVPTSITEAFMSCIGYKVFKYALKFCKFKPGQFLPAACVGVPLYFIKAKHIGNPAIMIPLILGVPMICFYVYIYAIDGSNLEAARKDKLLFPVMENVAFYKVWEESWFKLDKINGKALLKTGPDLGMMIVVTLLDCLLMLSYTESNLPVTVIKDYEIQLDGLGSIVTAIMGSPVGYMILKFNVLNYGVMGNVKDRRAGVIYAVLCGVGYFFSIELINYIPRFFLGILLFFAGAGFVAENLWGSRKHLSLHEWMQIIAILVVFILTGELGYAILVGGLLTGLDFIFRYARVPCTSGNPLRGGELVSRERHGPVLQRNLQHIANSWLLIIKLKGYVFFASAQKLTQFIRAEMESQASVAEYRRLKFITIDCQLLDGMDASATKAMKKLEKEAHALHMRILWSHVNDKVVQDLKQRGLVQTERDIFEDLDEVKTYVERHALEYRACVQRKWLKLHPAFMLAKEMTHARVAFEPFKNVFLVDAVRRGCPWQYCGVLPVKAFETVLWEPGQLNQDLFLIHSGTIGLYSHKPNQDKEQDWEDIKPLAIYRHGWFLNRDILIRAPTRHYAVCYSDGEVLYWNERQWSRMAREVPLMASAISKMVMKQQVLDSDHMQMVVHPDDKPVFDEICEEEELMNTTMSVNRHSLLPRSNSLKSRRSAKSSASNRTSATLKTTHSSHSSARAMLSNLKGYLYSSTPPPNRAEEYNAAEHQLSDGRQSNGSMASMRSSQGSGGCLPAEASSQTHGQVQCSAHHMVDAPEIPTTFDSTHTDTTLKEERPEQAMRPASSLKARGSRPSLFSFLPHLFDDMVGGTASAATGEDEFSRAGRYVEKSTVAQLLIPEQLKHRLNGIQTAQVLDRLDLYHSATESQSSSTPRLPKLFEADLVIAFNTYCEVDEDGPPYLDAQNLPAAIMYSGIFNTLVKPVAPLQQRKMSLRDFIRVGHKAVMATLSDEQEKRIDKVFQEFDADGSGELDREELIQMFRRMFHPDISIEEVDGVASAWLDEEDDTTSDTIDKVQFRAIISHIIREHEQDWTLICGLRDLMGKRNIDNNDKLYATTMVDFTERMKSPLTLEEAEEMLWVADWRLQGHGEGRSLEFVDVVAAVLLDINLPQHTKLPPRPRVRNKNSSAQSTQLSRLCQFEVGRCECGNIFKEDSVFCRRCGRKRPEQHKNDNETETSEEFLKLIVDLRDEAHDLNHLCAWAKNMAPPARSLLEEEIDHEIEDTRQLHKQIMDRHDGNARKNQTEHEKAKVPSTFTLGEDKSLKMRIWCLLEEPRSSKCANLLSMFMGIMIMASVMALVFEPLTERTDRPQSEIDAWKIVELYFTVIFSMELVVRFCVADAVQGQTRTGFLKAPSNICDFTAVLPYYVEVVIGEHDNDQFKLLRVARLMRLSRVMRLAKLSNRSAMFGPIAMVLTVIWGIYLKTIDE